MDELLKQRLMMAIVAFNLTIIIYQVGFNSGGSFTMLKVFIGVAIAAAAAAAAYVATQMTQR